VLTPTVNVPYKNKNFNICNSDVFAMPPQNNMMVVFPSTLPHSVEPSKSNTERFCIAFNLFAFGELDKGGRSQLGLHNITKA
jgi:Rps23 Pro-64 3,4-dihydroxylase Tpa1-like proline 4-hydroxylase